MHGIYSASYLVIRQTAALKGLFIVGSQTRKYLVSRKIHDDLGESRIIIIVGLAEDILGKLALGIIIFHHSIKHIPVKHDVP